MNIFTYINYLLDDLKRKIPKDYFIVHAKNGYTFATRNHQTAKDYAHVIPGTLTHTHEHIEPTRFQLIQALSILFNELSQNDMHCCVSNCPGANDHVKERRKRAVLKAEEILK